jgi:sulfite reductase alpha subunit-like flavoprotein/Pyruvate/2-oxoacid:ferredoxin oxidoreductase gamma subunit/ferredoxin
MVSIDFDHSALTHLQVALNPNHPIIRGTGQRPDIFMQNAVAAGKFYDAAPALVQETMDEVGALTGRTYNLFDYYGDPNADRVAIAMGSGTSTITETVDYLNSIGEKTGVLKVRLYRPWDASSFLGALPETARDIVVLDRTREDGAVGQPLFLDVSASLTRANDSRNVVGGQFGLASKEFTPKHVAAAFENLRASQPKHNFVVGIRDDVTHTSLEVGPEIDTIPEGTKQCLFWGLGTDGTVGANKAAIKTLAMNTPLFTQGHFAYDSHKGGGVTMSHLRFGPSPHMPEYEIQQGADYIACGNTSYVTKFDMIKTARPGATFLLNTPWVGAELEEKLPVKMKETIAQRDLNFYTIDATKVAKDIGLGQRINTVMQAAFYHLSGVLPSEQSVELLKEDIVKLYSKKGPAVVAMNHKAVDSSVDALVKIDIPAAWAAAATPEKLEIAYGSGVATPYLPTEATSGIAMPQPSRAVEAGSTYHGKVPFDDPIAFADEIMHPVLALEGDELPVSVFTPGGYMPSATTQFEKRAIAPEVPVWLADNCTQCNYCAIVCPHAVIRPFLFDKEGQTNKPDGMVMKKAQGGAELSGMHYSINLATMDCTGCAVCVESCPDDALVMSDFTMSAHEEVSNWEYALKASIKDNPSDKFSVKGSQFETPLLEFSGACAGCGETPYVKLITQLYGSRMMIANASGCSSVWGGTSTTNPYTVDKDGRGPAWGRSLFEDNAEFGLGMALASLQRREALKVKVAGAVDGEVDVSEPLRQALASWLDVYENATRSDEVRAQLLPLLEAERQGNPLLESIFQGRDMLTKHSQWIIGGDGWAYDIGFGGLDHVLAKGEDVNIVVLDTEMYSNTGGQVSKSTPQSALVKFAANGKEQAKKDLGQIAMGYENVYVASVAMGADYNQAVQAFREAEEHKGTSLVLCYSPCIDWGIDMSKMMSIQKLAVDSGYWPLYRFKPSNASEGENPFMLDSRRIKTSLANYLKGENRYAALRRADEMRADNLQGSFELYTHKRMETMQRRAMDDHELLDLLKARVGEQTSEKVLVLYASETGNTADLAKSLAYELKRRDQRVSVMAMDDFDVSDLPNQKLVISLAATCGQGEFPSNSKAFRQELADESLPADFLDGVKFATFAMGDSGYVFYNNVGSFFHNRFVELGATAMLDCGMGDDQDEDKWETAWTDWAPALYDEMALPQPPQELMAPSNKVVIRPASEAAGDVKIPFIAPSDAGGPGVLVPIETSRPLTPGGRDVRHYEFNIKGTGLSYEAGDALAVFSTNGADRVDEFLDWYGLHRSDIVSVTGTGTPLPDHMTAGQLFTEYLDIFGRPKRAFYEMLSLSASAPDEKEALAHLITKEGKQDLRTIIDDTCNFADVLKMFPSAKPDVARLLDFVPAIKPRLYSIASASEMHPDHIHCCIVEEDWTRKDGEVRHGQSTWFLRNQTPGQQWGTVRQLRNAPEDPFGTVANGPLVPCRVNPSVVHLPENPRTPLVMVGLGTGMAPFRSFIQQRVMQKAAGIEVGPMLLYFGARYEATEFLYGDEVNAWVADGTLTDLRTAFSRDQERKIYAQHRIEEEPELMYDYMVNKDAAFYLCGPAGNMPAQMKSAVVNAIAKCGNMSVEDATATVIDWQIKGKYNVEVW